MEDFAFETFARPDKQIRFAQYFTFFYEEQCELR